MSYNTDNPALWEVVPVEIKIDNSRGIWKADLRTLGPSGVDS